MNADEWTAYFTRNTAVNRELPLPEEPCELSGRARHDLARSIAIFQLGESGGGTRLLRYVASTQLDQLPGYPEAIRAFIAEEQSHAALLFRVLTHLGEVPLEKQWTNSAFRWLRNRVNLEFNIQVLLTAELIAEVFFGMVALRTSDPVMQRVARKLLRDEIGHLRFQREFLAVRLRNFPPGTKRLWVWQFQGLHLVTAWVVAWDHRHCLKQLGWRPWQFRNRAARSLRHFLRQLGSMGCPEERSLPAAKSETRPVTAGRGW